MGPVSATMPIDVPREQAFDFLLDLANRPAFMGRFFSDFHLQRLESRGVDATARFRVQHRGLWMETTIVEVQPPFRILERGRGSRLGRMPVHTAWETTGVGASACEVKVIHWTEPAHPLDRLAEAAPGLQRWYRRSLAGALAQLGALLEGGEATERAAVAGGDRVPGAG